MKTAMTIAGSDCSGGAGIQADLKTMTMNGTYGMSVITALTAQNTCGVYGIYPVAPAFVKMQLNTVYDDIRPDAVKVGMVLSPDIIHIISESLIRNKQSNIVIDPEMISSSGNKLLGDEGIKTLEKELFTIADLITPNIPEAEAISRMKISTKEDVEKAAEKIGKMYVCSVLIKGGLFDDDASDFLWSKETTHWFQGKKLENKKIHGSGCTLSSAITSNLAKGHDMVAAITRSKAYVTETIKKDMDLGLGEGPLCHNFGID